MAFSMSPAAADAVRHRIETSSIERPVAGMVDGSDSLPVSRELSDALRRKASKAELKAIAKREFSTDGLTFRLVVGVYSESQFPSWKIATINGVKFVLPFWARLALRNWMLDFADGRFMLRNGDRVRYTLTNANRGKDAA
jgi:hypothetical protein